MVVTQSNGNFTEQLLGYIGDAGPCNCSGETSALLLQRRGLCRMRPCAHKMTSPSPGDSQKRSSAMRNNTASLIMPVLATQHDVTTLTHRTFEISLGVSNCVSSVRPALIFPLVADRRGQRITLFTMPQYSASGSPKCTGRKVWL